MQLKINFNNDFKRTLKNFELVCSPSDLLTILDALRRTANSDDEMHPLDIAKANVMYNSLKRVLNTEFDNGANIDKEVIVYEI